MVTRNDKLDPNWEWKKPINFYGRVIDQHWQPVPGATVKFGWTTLNREGHAKAQTISDERGHFKLSGKKGKSLLVRVSKHGYYTVKRQRISFEFAGFWDKNFYEPSSQDPVVFHLWKKGEGSAMAEAKVRPILPPNGAPIRLDLFNEGRAATDGPLEVAAVTNTEKYPPGRFDWRASISVRGGGLSEHDLEFPFVAPEAGYVPQVVFDMQANSAGWKRVVDKQYFIKFGSPPRYGRIEVSFNGASQRCHLKYSVNPTGSRNLEPSTDH